MTEQFVPAELFREAESVDESKSRGEKGTDASNVREKHYFLLVYHYFSTYESQ